MGLFLKLIYFEWINLDEKGSIPEDHSHKEKLHVETDQVKHFHSSLLRIRNINNI